MSNETETITARKGAWTPWARVLCVECEYIGLKDSPRAQSYATRFKAVTAMARAATIEQPEGNLLGSCDECRCTCWVRDDVALLQQVGLRSADLDCPSGWALQQTGGMCAALVFSTEGRQIVVTAMDGAFYIGEYVHINGEEDSWDRVLRTWESASLYLDGAMKDKGALEVMVDECTRKAIGFICNPATADGGGK